MKRGELVTVIWMDIHDCPSADPDEVSPAEMETIGHHLGWVTKEIRGKKVRFLRISTTICSDGSYQGACAFPEGIVQDVKRYT